MFHHLHHKNWFPLVVIVLSVGLLLFVAWAYKSANDIQEAKQQAGLQPTITTSDYQRETKKVLGNFWSDYLAAAEAAAKLVVVEKAEDELLSRRVPSEYRALHLELASSLELLRSGLAQNDGSKIKSGLDQLEAVFADNKWLGESDSSL